MNQSSPESHETLFGAPKGLSTVSPGTGTSETIRVKRKPPVSRRMSLEAPVRNVFTRDSSKSASEVPIREVSTSSAGVAILDAVPEIPGTSAGVLVEETVREQTEQINDDP